MKKTTIQVVVVATIEKKPWKASLGVSVNTSKEVRSDKPNRYIEIKPKLPPNNSPKLGRSVISPSRSTKNSESRSR